MFGPCTEDLKENFAVLMILLGEVQDRVIGLHAAQAMWLSANVQSGGTILGGGITFDRHLMAMKYSSRGKILSQFARAIKRKSDTSKDPWIRILKQQILIRPYKWTLARLLRAHGHGYTQTVALKNMFSFVCCRLPLSSVSPLCAPLLGT